LNIVLIGMPGAGKTTIGKLLSDKFSFKFYDSDDEIEEYAGKKITQIFAEDGEEVFRDIESRIIKELSGKDSSVLSLGGGAILRSENIDVLKSNSKIIFLNRPLENIVNDIEVAERPLLKDGKEKIYNLYNNRIELYKKYADIEIANDTDIETVINNIVKKIEEAKWKY